MPTYLNTKLILQHRDVHAELQLIIRIFFIMSILDKGSMDNHPPGKP